MLWCLVQQACNNTWRSVVTSNSLIVYTFQHKHVTSKIISYWCPYRKVYSINESAIRTTDHWWLSEACHTKRPHSIHNFNVSVLVYTVYYMVQFSQHNRWAFHCCEGASGVAPVALWGKMCFITQCFICSTSLSLLKCQCLLQESSLNREGSNVVAIQRNRCSRGPGISHSEGCQMLDISPCVVLEDNVEWRLQRRFVLNHLRIPRTWTGLVFTFKCGGSSS